MSNSGNMFIYTYPGTQSVGTLSGKMGYGGLCSDDQGNVFTEEISASGLSSTIFEYSHGGTTPIATFADRGIAFGCAIDPTSGNLAVANFEDSNNPDDVGDIAVYPSETGTPKIYVSQSFGTYYFCGYDDEGNLFISATLSASDPPKPVLVGLAKGSNSLTKIKLKTRLFWGLAFFIRPCSGMDTM